MLSEAFGYVGFHITKCCFSENQWDIASMILELQRIESRWNRESLHKNQTDQIKEE